MPSYNPFRVSTADTYGLKTPVYEDTKNSDYDHRLKAVEKYSNALNETLKNGKYEAGSTDYKWKKNKWKV